MTTSRISENGSNVPDIKSLCHFLCTYASRLLGVGATCIRIEKNVRRIANAYGMEVEMVIMPRHVHITLYNYARTELMTSITSVCHCGTSFNINTGLSRLSWEIADGKIDFNKALESYDSIISNDRQSQWVVLLLVTLANASFCRLFGGDFIAMAIVGIATMAGYYTKTVLMRHGTDARIMVLVCSFVSAVFGATDMLFSIGTTPAVAIGTSILYLVPGIPFLNSFSDMLYRHYLCAISRFADAVALTFCLSGGLCLAMFLMNTGMF